MEHTTHFPTSSYDGPCDRQSMRAQRVVHDHVGEQDDIRVGRRHRNPVLPGALMTPITLAGEVARRTIDRSAERWNRASRAEPNPASITRHVCRGKHDSMSSRCVRQATAVMNDRRSDCVRRPIPVRKVTARTHLAPPELANPYRRVCRLPRVPVYFAPALSGIVAGCLKPWRARRGPAGLSRRRQTGRVRRGKAFVSRRSGAQCRCAG